MAIIKLKRSDTPGNVPASLEHGEVGVNIPDKKIYIGSGDTDGTPVLIVDGNAVGGSTSTETIQDAAASLFTTGTHTGISVSYPDTNNAINLINTGVLSFNTRTGTVSLTSGDVTTALGFTPTAYTAPTLGSTTLTSGTTITTVAGLSSVTSTSFVGALTGNASTVTNGVYTTDAGTVTNTMLAGSIANNKLTNSSVTVNGSSISLGESTTITATATNALIIGTGLSGSSYNGSTGVTIAIDSTVATLTGNQTLTNKTLTSPTISNLYLSDGLILVEGTTNDSNEMSLVVGMLTADRTITFPNATGTVITTGNLTSITSTGTISSGTWNGTAIGTVYGGTGLTSFTSGGILFASSSSALTTGTVFDIDSTSNVNRINIVSGATPKSTQEFKVSETAFNSSAIIGVYTDVSDNPPGSFGQAYVNLASTTGTDSQIVLASGVGSVTFAGGTTPLSLTTTPSLWGLTVGVLYCIDDATDPYIIFGDDGTNNATSIKITDTLSTMVVAATTLQINTSTPVAGKILTCTDSNGTVSWEDNAAADMILFSMGFI
jgi:hypothetical protein